MMKNRRFSVWCLVTMTIVPLFQVGLAADVPTTPSVAPTAEQIAHVSELLQKKDPESLDTAVKELRSWAASGKVPGTELSRTLLPSLIAAKRDSDVADICLETVLANPSSGNIQDFFSVRVGALQRLGRDDEALQTAKSLYNGCDMKYIDKAIPIVATALELTHPGDNSIGRRFSLAQAQSTARGGKSGAPTSADANILKDVKIDSSIYIKALDQWRAKVKEGPLTVDEAHDAEKYANLLLVADRCEDAEKIFRGLIKNTPGEGARQKSALLRALKGVDGNLTRASSAQSAAGDKSMP